jgi:hypothetical protein
MTDDVLRVAVLTVPCLFGLWTAIACRQAQYHGLPGSDALVWAGLSGAFFLLSLMKTARGHGLLRGFGDFLRGIFKQRGWYEDPRSLQITASIAVAVVVMALVVWGLRWTRHSIQRYRLAIGFAALTVGFGIIRFISLHEVDAWNAHAFDRRRMHMPWARTAVDLVAAAGVSAVAIARLYQLTARSVSFQIRNKFRCSTLDPVSLSWPSSLILFLLSLPAWALRGARCRRSQSRNLRNLRWRGAPHPLKPVAGGPLP